MGSILIKPKAIVRRGMKRTIEDLGTDVVSPDVHDICAMHVDSWSADEEAIVQAEIDRHKAE